MTVPFSRHEFLAGSGVLVVGFCAASCGLAGGGETALAQGPFDTHLSHIDASRLVYRIEPIYPVLAKQIGPSNASRVAIQHDLWGIAYGTFQAYVCRSCLLAEIHVESLQLKPNSDLWVEYATGGDDGGEPPGDPYR